jgi:hypothetical protein
LRPATDDLVRGGIEEVREKDHDTASGELRRGVPGGCQQVGRAVRRLDPRQLGQEPEDAAGAAQRHPATRGAAAQRAERDPVFRRETDVAERGRGPLRELELVRPARRHRRRGVEQEGDRDVLLLDEELHEELLEAGEDVPVELAEVVAEGVVAEVGELDALSALDAAPAALQRAPGGRPHDQEPPLQLPEECLVEDGRIQLAGEERRTRARIADGRRQVGRATALGHRHVGAATAAIRRSGARPCRGLSGSRTRS